MATPWARYDDSVVTPSVRAGGSMATYFVFFFCIKLWGEVGSTLKVE